MYPPHICKSKYWWAKKSLQQKLQALIKNYNYEAILIEGDKKKFYELTRNIPNEKIIKINGLTKRYDVVVFQPNGNIFLVVECKQPNVAISQTVFDQIARYNLTLKANYLMATNGLNHYFCQMDLEKESYLFLKEIPNYNSIAKTPWKKSL